MAFLRLGKDWRNELVPGFCLFCFFFLTKSLFIEFIFCFTRFLFGKSNGLFW